MHSLACTPERAFEVFTSELATWWPLETHGVFKADADSVVFETREGGRIVETSKDSTENVWATVSMWNPPKRVVFSWAPDVDKAVETEVEVRIAPDGDGTRFELIHRGWERWAEQAHALPQRATTTAGSASSRSSRRLCDEGGGQSSTSPRLVRRPEKAPLHSRGTQGRAWIEASKRAACC